MDDDQKEDLVGNRLTVVPAVGVYTAKPNTPGMRGRLGVSASYITCAPKETDTEPSQGIWSASKATLTATIDPETDSGPRSGLTADYVTRAIGIGRHRLMISSEALLGVVEGRSSWGDSGEKAGRLLVWKWSYDDIDEISVGRLKKLMKMWDTELWIRTHDPETVLDFNAYGQDSHVFRAADAVAKAKRTNGSDLLGFATTLATAISQHRGCETIHTSDGDAKEPSDVFTFG